MTHVEPGISKTALWVAAARAIGARELDPAIRNPDHLAEALLGEARLEHPVFDALALPYGLAMQEIEVASMVRAMTERSRFIGEALERAVSRGISQCLIVGAGLDSHACRCRDLLAGVQVYELDRPETSAFKRQRVDAVLGGPPPNLTYVASDLEREALPEALARHGYDPSRRSFVIMEGVSMYVQEEPLRSTFRFFAAHAKGSSVVFDFATRSMIDAMKAIHPAKMPAAARPPIERLMKLIEHEPWVFGIPLDSERAFLSGLGLELGGMLTIGSEESARRYLTRADGTTMGAQAHAKAQAFRESMLQRMLESLAPEHRDRAAAAMREQERQNAYRIAEAFN